jgi:two-component system OmpR family sensor kinase
MVTLVIEVGQDKRLALQLARSLEPLESVRDDIRWLLLLFGVISLVVAGATSWIMTGRSMQPVARIAREARAISTASLGRRLPAPGMADEIGELVDVINAMLDRLHSEVGNQRQFMTNVSHELKTPLTVLLGEVQAVERKGGEADIAEFARTVREEARRMLRTVQSFLILSRVQRGERLSIVSDVVIEETVIEAVQACRDSAAGRGVRIVTHLDIDEAVTDAVVRGDGDLLRSMLENLIHNAVRHSPKGGVVRVNTAVSVKDATVVVTDSGPGIPEDHLQVIFEPFIQANPSGPGAGSVGVGLAIAKGVADLHGGNISAENLPGGGAKFTVRLPVATSA